MISLPLLLVILVLILLFGGVGYTLGGQPWHAGGGIGFVILILVLLYLLQPGLFK